MQIGLIDVDGHHFPNLPLMKLSAWHKKHGDTVTWYNPLFSEKQDIVYMSKVFTFTPDFPYPVFADTVIKGGTGYFYPTGGEALLSEIEHTYPDYSLYESLTRDTAYGFLTRGCPCGCDFCIVGDKEGKKTVKAADLEEFWHGQKHIVLLDPNFFACAEWESLAKQLIQSRAWIDFSQGCDIRSMNDGMIDALCAMKIQQVHFAWDRIEDAAIVMRNLEHFKVKTKWGRSKITVFVLTNFNTTLEQDLQRIYALRDIGVTPYVMIYNKDVLPKGHVLYKLQRYVNSKYIFYTIPSFTDYRAG